MYLVMLLAPCTVYMLPCILLYFVIYLAKSTSWVHLTDMSVYFRCEFPAMVVHLVIWSDLRSARRQLLYCSGTLRIPCAHVDCCSSV